jgi:hypothetical protein
VSFWTKPIYVKFRLWSLLILLIVLGIIISGVVLYKNYVFHNLFFRTLSLDKIESICVYNYYGQGATVLSEEETEAVVSLLRHIRLKEEPFKNFGLLGDQGDDYHIRLKNGISFDLDLSGGNPGVYIINDRAYSIGCREDLNAAEDFENIWRLEELHSEYVKKYYPNDK